MTIVSFTLPNFEKYCSNPLSSVFHDNPPTKIFVPFVTRAGDAAADDDGAGAGGQGGYGHRRLILEREKLLKGM